MIELLIVTVQALRHGRHNGVIIYNSVPQLIVAVGHNYVAEALGHCVAKINLVVVDMLAVLLPARNHDRDFPALQRHYKA